MGQTDSKRSKSSNGRVSRVNNAYRSHALNCTCEFCSFEFVRANEIPIISHINNISRNLANQINQASSSNVHRDASKNNSQSNVSSEQFITINVPKRLQKYVFDDAVLKEIVNFDNLMFYSEKNCIHVNGKNEYVTMVQERINKLLTKITIKEITIENYLHDAVVKEITKIQNDTDTDIQLSDEKTHFLIQIYGFIENVDKAEQTMKDIIYKYKTESIRVDKKYFEIFSSNNEKLIKDICLKSKALINILSHGDGFFIVEIKGTIQQVAAAQNEILKTIADTEQKLAKENASLTLQQIKAEKEKEDIKNEILIQLKCKICHKLMKPPIFMCAESHNICNPCKSTSKTCNCGKSIEQTRNFQLENLSAKVKEACQFKNLGCQFIGNTSELDEHTNKCLFTPKTKCTFSPQGCSYLGTLNDLEVYGKQCPYKTSKCPLHNETECQWIGVYGDLKIHAQSDHNTLLSCILQQQVLKINMKRKTIKDSFLVMIYGEVFKISLNMANNPSPLIWSAKCLSYPCNESEAFILKLELIDYTGKQLKFIASEFCNDVKNSYSLSIPRKLVTPYVHKTKLYYKLNIIKAT